MRRSAITRKLARVDRALDRAIEKAELPGAVILARIRREGEVLEHLSARGLAVVRPERIPVTRETVYDLASLTKVMATTTAVARLVAEGRLDLDAPVAAYLPHFAERGKQGVTLRHLLTHSSGLRPWRAYHEILLEKERRTGQRILGTPEARDFVLESICRSRLLHEPGTAAVYGDLDFIALGAVVEAVTGEPLDRWCREALFGPMGLSRTGYRPFSEKGEPPEGPDRRGIAATENCPWRQRIVWGAVHDPNAWALGGVAGHAGLFAPADDVMRFALFWMDAWHGRSEWLPQEVARTFCERQGLPPDSDWALGFDTPSASGSSSGSHFSPHSVGHLGFTGTSVWIDLEREAVIVMLANRHHLVAKRSRFALRPLIHDLVMEAFLA